MGTEHELAERIAKLEIEMQNVQNGNRLFKDDLREEVREIRKQNESIHEIATSVKLMANDIRMLREDMNDVKESQKEISGRMDTEITNLKKEQTGLKESILSVDHKEATNALKFWNSIKEKLAWLVVGAVAAYFLYQAFPFLK